jgi:hypothetical protein
MGQTRSFGDVGSMSDLPKRGRSRAIFAPDVAAQRRATRRRWRARQRARKAAKLAAASDDAAGGDIAA